MKYEVIKPKSKILNLYSDVDPWFWISGSINPYRGCEHACIYCDGRANYYNIPDFTTRIRIKENAPELLKKDLLKLGFRPINLRGKQTISYYFNNQINLQEIRMDPKAPLIAIGGGVCDVYQPAEKRFKITRRILKVLLDFGFPLMILTKSNLILRDLDLIKKFAEYSYANISFSITLMDEKIQKLIEPNSSTTSERFNALKKFKEIGCLTGVMAMPLLPGIGDTIENIEGIISKSAEIGVDYILFSGLTLKTGNKEVFFRFIENNFPHLLNLYHLMFDNASVFGTPLIPKDYKHKNFIKTAHELCKKYHILDRMPRFIPEGSNKTNLRISEILHNISYLKQYVHNSTSYTLKKYTNSAKLIEKFPKDLHNFSLEQLQIELGLDHEISKLVYEIISTNSAKLYEKLY
ncbi:MAG: radical SAM protein [Candidatus Helarchaeota archaeon]